MKKLYFPIFHSLKKSTLILLAGISLCSLSAEAQFITGLTLINADTDQPIGALVNESTIDLATLPTRNINVQANKAAGQPTFSVLFAMNGVTFPLERLEPYTLFGDVVSPEGVVNYNAGALPGGRVTISATPYIDGVAQPAGRVVVVLNVTPFSITGFTLVNADTNEDLGIPLTNGTALDLATLPTRNLNIRANTDPRQVGSVMLNWQALFGETTTVTNVRENIAPYTLFGDTTSAEGVIDYRTQTLPLGTHTLTATAYPQANAGGTATAPLSVTFTVRDGVLTATPGELLGQQAKMALTAFPNPATAKATILFSVPTSGQVTVDVYDLKGTLVKQLFADNATAGTNYTVDVPTARLHNGIYFFRMTNGSQTLTQRLVVTK